MIFRNSTPEDVPQMVQIANDGKALLKSKGINQWQRGTYPDGPLFKRDVEQGIGYVVSEGDEVLAICAVTFTVEESYNRLESGCWKTPDDGMYATIHRGAVAKDHHGKHIIDFLFSSVEEMAKEKGAQSIRLDTHPENLTMQRALARSGFEQLNTFYILDGDEAGDLRYGYEKVL